MRRPTFVGESDVVEPSTGLVFPRWNGVHSAESEARIPSREPLYAPDPSALESVQFALAHGLSIHLGGAPGTGKSLFPVALANLVGAPLRVIHINGDTRNLLGQYSLNNGKVVFVPGPLALGFAAGDWTKLEEFTTGDPGVLHAAHPILAGERQVTLPDGSTIKRGRGFVAWATTNNVPGARKYSGNFGTNEATLSRFAVKINLKVLSETQLVAVLCNAVETPISTRTRAVAKALTKWFLSMHERSTQDANMARPSMRDLNFVWMAFHTPVRRVDGPRRRRLSDAAKCVLENAWSPSEAAIALDMLHAHTGHLDV